MSSTLVDPNITEIRSEIKNLRMQIKDLRVLQKYGTKLNAFLYLMNSQNIDQDIVRIFKIDVSEISLAKVFVEDTTTYCELYREDIPPLVIAAVAKMRGEEMTCIEQYITSVEGNPERNNVMKDVITNLGLYRKKIVELRREMTSKREREVQSIKSKKSDDITFERPLSARTIEFQRLEEILRFEHIASLSEYVVRQNPCVVYFQNQLNISKLVNAIEGKENIMLVFRTTNSSLFFGLYSEKKITKNSFCTDDQSFFVFVTSGKDVLCYSKKEGIGETVLVSDKKADSVVVAQKGFTVFFAVINEFMNTRMLKCYFHNEMPNFYTEKNGKPLPFKTGLRNGFEVLSIYSIQWN
ncbi:hypothetical protein EIN_053510 [Entamoeba invadens IP1]|uniref:hypothetical protein n=1 Tax=Entamoeba invadens IP1 TaxID=370355 RepID=UPI0002C3F429|nr:hypothetical protein EIN_053510 [Entamoeba invadens IP1]ELP93106.1 hypothetical protein EIN_053510 [Entamoeba invadens IP1]|eukprot:XP_004259877.1 hypothetical protein EIN_053510 [Entamoeba invadens IP1]